MNVKFVMIEFLPLSQNQKLQLIVKTLLRIEFVIWFYGTIVVLLGIEFVTLILILLVRFIDERRFIKEI